MAGANCDTVFSLENLNNSNNEQKKPAKIPRKKFSRVIGDV